MEIKHGLHLSQRPSLIMTQRLQQALKLLQLPQLELNMVIKQELQSNPVLEEVDELVEEPAQTEERAGDAETPVPEPEPESPKTDSEEEDWSEYYQNNDWDNPYVPSEDHSAEYFEKVAVTTMGLNEHLESQLLLVSLNDEEMEVGLRSVAAPLRNARGKAIAALNVSSSTLRVALRTLRGDFLPALLETAERINARRARR